MTDVQDDRLMRDGFREKALGELLADRYAPTQEIEVRWLGPKQVAEVRIDVKALDRLIDMATSPDLTDQIEEAAEDAARAGRDEGHQRAKRKIITILNSHHVDDKALIGAIEKWAES